MMSKHVLIDGVAYPIIEIADLPIMVDAGITVQGRWEPNPEKDAIDYRTLPWKTLMLETDGPADITVYSDGTWVARPRDMEKVREDREDYLRLSREHKAAAGADAVADVRGGDGGEGQEERHD